MFVYIINSLFMCTFVHKKKDTYNVKTTSNLNVLNLNNLKFNKIWPLEGAKHGKIFGGIPKILVSCNFLKNVDGVRQNDSLGF